MAHFAELDENNIVKQVIVVNNLGWRLGWTALILAYGE
jgi:hypothetical protein